MVQNATGNVTGVICSDKPAAAVPLSSTVLASFSSLFWFYILQLHCFSSLSLLVSLFPSCSRQLFSAKKSLRN